MSGGVRPQRKWRHRAVAAVIVLGCYWTVHRATASHYRALGTDHVCRDCQVRDFGNTFVPRWVERVFWPAERVDELISGDPFVRR
jgi:hypothetical protein